MTIQIRISHYALCIVLPVVVFVGSASAAPTPETMAKRVEEFYKDRPDIRAKFTQSVKKPGRKRVLTKEGKVFFKRPGKMRWDYTKPEQVFYISDGETLWNYQPEDALVTRLDVRSSELYHQSRYLFGQGALSEDFDAAEGTNTEPALESLYHLTLTPKRSSRNFKSLTLHVDPSSGEIQGTTLIDPYDNVSRIIFKKVVYKPLDTTHFVFTPPTGAIVKDLSGKRAQ
ncbi:MAG: outer membrane lipoprotein carrier protein LolA [Myxococcota bacterium]|nr:outer membrane lipoprotein carrier protein LolA [Myxococcota bacterium]